MEVDRRERVKRLKRTLIVVILIAILLPTVLSIYLMIRMHHLERKLDKIYQIKTEEITKMSEQTVKTAETKIYSLESAQNLSEDEKPSKQSEQNGRTSVSEDAYKVYLTFDDGPSKNTEEILKILREYDVKATFFVVGKEEPSYRKLYKEIVEDGHTIGMHSYSHRYDQIYQSVDSFTEDLDRIRTLIYEETGVNSMFYRFPGGSSNEVSQHNIMDYIKCLHDQGIEYIDWNISTGDAVEKSLTAEQILSNTFDDFGRYHTNVVLLHDTGNRTTTVEALPAIISRARDMGALLLPIDEDTIPIQHIQEVE